MASIKTLYLNASGSDHRNKSGSLDKRSVNIVMLALGNDSRRNERTFENLKDLAEHVDWHLQLMKALPGIL